MVDIVEQGQLPYIERSEHVLSKVKEGRNRTAFLSLGQPVHDVPRLLDQESLLRARQARDVYKDIKFR